MVADPVPRPPSKRLVVALGGNAISVRHQPLDAAPQVLNVQHAVDALAPLARDHQIVITHGNGPQIGLLALESSADPALVRPYPLDDLGAETQGLIGYWLAQALRNALPDREVVAVVTQTCVDRDDPAFGTPEKFIGPSYSQAQASALGAARGWIMRLDGPSWRRVVASPEPRSVVEIGSITRLVDAGAIVICGGGGGVPVVAATDGALTGVEAVVDKDLTSALVAEVLHADVLLLLTDVAAVSTDVSDPTAPLISRATPAEMRRHSFAPGSMGPKVEAACRFVERTGGLAAIGRLADATAILEGGAGTIIGPD